MEVHEGISNGRWGMVLSFVLGGDSRTVPGRLGIVLHSPRFEVQIEAENIGAQPNKRLKLAARVDY